MQTSDVLTTSLRQLAVRFAPFGTEAGEAACQACSDCGCCLKLPGLMQTRHPLGILRAPLTRFRLGTSFQVVVKAAWITLLCGR